MRNIRLLAMQKAIAESGTMTMTELCERFNVSMNTVRRDIAELKRRGEVEKVYGGVSAVESAPRTLRPFEERRQVDGAAKRAVCREAAKLVEEGDIIFADSGTTLTYLPDYLHGLREVTIVTNNLALVQQAIPYEQLRLIVLPGQLRRRTNSLTGLETVQALRRFNVHKAFLATTGTTVDGVTNSSPQEYEIKQTAIACCAVKVLLLSAEKFGQAGLMTYAHFSDFNYIVTDRPVAEPYAGAIARSGAKALIAKAK